MSATSSSRTPDFGFDLLDFQLARATDLLASAGPLTSDSVYALSQFAAVATSGGTLTLSSSSNVVFTSRSSLSPVPLPAAAPLFGCAVLVLAAGGTRVRCRSRTV